MTAPTCRWCSVLTMTDRPNHRAAAERILADARELGWQAEEPTHEAAEMSCLAYAAVHDTLTDLKPEPATYPRPSRPVTMTHPWPPWPSTLPVVDAADRYAANEARQREEAEPDPLDEDDHRDRLTRSGDLMRRKPNGRWAWVAPGFDEVDGWTLSDLNASDGPLTFAPDADDAPSATAPAADDPAGDAVGGEEGERRYLNAQTGLDQLLCPECGHGIDSHGWEADYAITCCLACDDPADCRKAPSDIARALIEQAANIERTRLTGQLRLTTSSVQDSGDLAELDALADEWEAR